MGANVPPSSDSAARPGAQQIARVVLYAGLLALALWVIRAFIPAIAWACVIAIALWPLLKRFESHRLFRERPTVVATVITAAVSLLVVLPVAVALIQAIGQAHDLREWLRTVQDNGIPVPDVVARLPVGAPQVAAWWQAHLGHPLHAEAAMKGVNSETFIAFGRHFGSKLAHAVLEFGFMLVTLFVILRAGHKLSGALLQGVQRAFGGNGAQLIERMAAAVHGTVTGLVVVGLGEGALLGVAYVLAGVPHAALLGLVTAVAAMLPFCAPIVFCGAALWLFVQGATAWAVAVAAIGFVVVFVAEHFVRPVLIGSSARLPFLLVLFGILGGAETFGLLGLFIGPALMTVLTMLWAEWVA
ncbi:AI-2E family transporter [Burkholderia ubonensis]|uniref:AI-2E family transporter n=1 Tax=Burkholderia ubonensis TaxID=101571 RepID=UPI000BA7AB39|nr:AI-2E family transporter [Burkholderia ubonensis]PAK15413.1 AI-2E family transporter [Burkholderia ubonensis]RQP27037.1 AI-2E family transporter [Burkholderia ubonensis]RQP28610.1 AI-2E family transporter [Burkholderia ubonensis]RQP29511.1 AI-2E family transporter [Burkholderia ubonensis]RQP45982.1 AI-2E family transporter [Burkholderia ubonensis]